MKYTTAGRVEKVEAAYEGYGENKELKGAKVTAEFTERDLKFQFILEIPKGSVDSYPTVGDSIEIIVG